MHMDIGEKTSPKYSENDHGIYGQEFVIMQSTQHHIIMNGKQTDSRIHKKQVNLRSKAQRIKSITQFQDF